LICAAAGCSNLPEIRPGQCGNRVVEGKETCDGFPIGEASCRPPDSPGQCQLDCSARQDGSRPACPAGFGCSTMNLCRPSSGNYHEVPESIPGNAFSLLTGDFDGDRRADIVSLEPAGTLSATKFRVHYFDRNGALASTHASPMTLLSLAVADVAQGASDDLVLSTGRVGVLLGQADRTLISETYPTYALANANVRIAGSLYHDLIDDIAPLLALVESNGVLEVKRPDKTTKSLKSMATLYGRIDDLAGDPALGALFEDKSRYPCLDTALAFRGASEVSIHSVCQTDDDHVVWRESAVVHSVQLSPAAPIERGPLLADMDGDGHLDVLIGAADRLYVAFGDGHELSVARPYAVSLEVASGAPPLAKMPLAAGDINGDHAADLVYPDGFWLSHAGPSRADWHYEAMTGGLITGWSDARIADLNGNGLPDVLAISDSNLDIMFFNGTGGDRLHPFVIPTARPVRHIAVRDLDGDLINDLVFTQTGAPDEQLDVAVAYGNSAGPPTAAVTVARVPGVEQIGALEYNDDNSTGPLFVAYRQTDENGNAGSALAWLVGVGDRDIVSLVELTTFVTDTMIEGSLGLRLTTGRFTAPDRLDALLVGSPDRAQTSMWLMPNLRSRRSGPVDLGWGFDPRMVANRELAQGNAGRQVTLLMAAGDLDNDGVDELVAAAPDQSDEHCLVSTARVVRSDSFELQVNAPLQLDGSCARGQLATGDLDGDDHPEIVLMTGSVQGPGALFVLWNDGAGGYASDSVSSVAGAEVAPQAFALFRSTPTAAMQIAYATATRVNLWQAKRPQAGPANRELDSEFQRATGIVGADVDGDGITDLVVADAGRVRVLRAELEP
jgi:hypothetical protein